MNICGIVSEFNPFHAGHAYLIEEIRRSLGEDTGVVCAMSGDFVQRGAAAAFSKHDRARAAVAGGADLVLELPLPWCIASAERFAFGGVNLLLSTGCLTHLAFGSECGDLPALERTAALLLRPEMDGLIRENLRTGVSYAAARQAAAERLAGERLPMLADPNDILALEYLKALRGVQSDVKPVAVQRKGAGHDSGEAGEYPSASFLRRKLDAGEAIDSFLPERVSAALFGGSGPVDGERMEIAMLSRLRRMTAEDFRGLPDVSEGLEHRLAAAVRQEPDLESVIRAAASKRYPVSRIRRILCCAALGVGKEAGKGTPPYLRVLAANRRGQAVLRSMTECASVPVITKPSAVRGHGDRVEAVFSMGASGADLYALGLRKTESRCGDRDWRTTPYMASDQI